MQAPMNTAGRPLAGPLTKPISWGALLIWADSPVVRYRHAIEVGLKTVWVCPRLSRCAGGEFCEPVTGQHPKYCLSAPCHPEE
jgi:hypothetical protein